MPLGGRPWEEWIAQYGRSHEHPVNRLCHTIGIPLIVISLLVGLVALAVPGLWWIAAALFVSGGSSSSWVTRSRESRRSSSTTGASSSSACDGG